MEDDGATETALPSRGMVLFALATSSVPVSVAIAFVLELELAFGFVFLVTVAIVWVAGGLAYLAIRDNPRWQSIAIAGFATGAIVPASFGLLMFADVSRSFAQNLGEYAAMVGGFGIAGVVGAGIASLAVRTMIRSGLIANLACLLMIGAGVAGIWVLPRALADHSCHNLFRDGRNSISPIAGFTLEAPMADWREVEAELASFARADGWEFRADVRPDFDFPWFQFRLCREPGTVLVARRDPFEDATINIDAYQPQGGDSWQADLRAIQRHLEDRWPGGTGYDDNPNGPSPPPWAPDQERE